MMNPNFQVNDYILYQELGSGAFSTVYKTAKKQQPDVFYAMKVFKSNLEQNDIKSIQNQIDLLKRIQHPNIIKCIDNFNTSGKWYIVLQYCGKGDLQTYRKKQGKLPEMYAKSFIFKILEALKCVHENKIVHRDLKLANILINDSFDIKLADFGFSKDYEANMLTSYCGTPLTMAPQILDRKKYDEKCDTWSLGVISYILLFGDYPFKPTKLFGGGVEGLKNCIKKTKVPKFDINTKISEQAKDFILKCLTIDPRKRSSMQNLQKHAWFSSSIESKVRIGFLKQSFTDSSEIIEKTNYAINKTINNHILKLITKSLLTKKGTQKTLKLMEEYFPEQKVAQLLYLMTIAEKNQKLLESKIQFQMQEFHIEIKGQSILQLQESIKHFNAFLSQKAAKIKQTTDYKKEDLYDCERRLMKFVVEEGNKYAHSAQPPIEQLRLIKTLVDIVMDRIKLSRINVEYAVSQQMQTRKSFDNYIETLDKNQVLQMVNGFQEVNNSNTVQDDLSNEWLIEESFEPLKQEQRQGYCFYIGAILQRTFNARSDLNYEDSIKQ